MSKRGSYKKLAGKDQPPQWRRTFLAAWRNLREMTQEELAEASHLSVGLISNLETAKTGYSAKSLYKLAKALSVDPGMIISVNPEGNEALWSIISRATPQQREQIATHASVIVSQIKQKISDGNSASAAAAVALRFGSATVPITPIQTKNKFSI